MFTVVIEQIERIIRLVAGMREMYQVEVRDKAPLDISETVRKVLVLMQKAIQTQGIETVLRLADGLPRFVASSTHMQQVVFNVMLNALTQCLLEVRHAFARIMTRPTVRSCSKSSMMGSAFPKTT